MTKSLLAFLAVCALSALPAHATPIDFNFTFNAPTAGVAGAGTLMASLTSTPGEYLVTSVNAIADGLPLSLLPAGAFLSNDNLLFFPGSGNFVDSDGIAFTDTDGDKINVSFDSTGYNISAFDPAFGQTVKLPTGFTLSQVAVTPEPSSFLLLGTGVLGVFGMARRKFLAA